MKAMSPGPRMRFSRPTPLLGLATAAHRSIPRASDGNERDDPSGSMLARTIMRCSLFTMSAPAQPLLQRPRRKEINLLGGSNKTAVSNGLGHKLSRNDKGRFPSAQVVRHSLSPEKTASPQGATASSRRHPSPRPLLRLAGRRDRAPLLTTSLASARSGRRTCPCPAKLFSVGSPAPGPRD